MFCNIQECGKAIPRQPASATQNLFLAQGIQGADFSGLAAAQWLQNKDTQLTNTTERGQCFYEQYLQSGSGHDVALTDHKWEFCGFWQQ